MVPPLMLAVAVAVAWLCTGKTTPGGLAACRPMVGPVVTATEPPELSI